MISLLARMLSSFLILFSLVAQSADFIGQCTNDNDTVMNQFLFSIDSSINGYTGLNVDGVMSSPNGTAPTFLDRQSIVLDTQTVKENSPSRLVIDDGHFYLIIDRITGTGTYEYSFAHDTCWPGESEWCKIRIPGYTHRKFKLSECQIHL